MLKVNSEALVGPLNSVDLKDHIEMIIESIEFLQFRIIRIAQRKIAEKSRERGAYKDSLKAVC